MHRLQDLVSMIVRLKRTPSPTQAKQLQDMTQDLKVDLIRLQAKHLQLQGGYSEQAVTIQEIAKIAPRTMPANPMQPSYSSIAKIGAAKLQVAKTNVVLVYPKEDKKDQVCNIIFFRTYFLYLI